MTEEEKLLNDFERKFWSLIEAHERLKAENLSLKQLLEEKEKAVIKLQNDYEVMKGNYTNLKQARIISINDSELKNTKQRLSRLVREVDKCISLLEE